MKTSRAFDLVTKPFRPPQEGPLAQDKKINATRLKYIPCLGQHPQFYYPVKDKRQTEHRLFLKSFIGNCN